MSGSDRVLNAHIYSAASLKCFSDITTVSGSDRVLNAHIYSAASLKCQAPGTWHDTTTSHVILTMGRPLLALPLSLSAKRGAISTIFNDFGMSRPGIEPVTFRSPKRYHFPFYHLSCRGRYTLSVCCCVDIISSLNGYCTCTDADDM